MSYFDDQEEAWWDGGKEWYMKSEGLDPKDDEGGIPADFDPYLFWAEKGD